MPFTEKSLVEDYIVKKLQEKGWKLIPADELERIKKGLMNDLLSGRRRVKIK